MYQNMILVICLPRIFPTNQKPSSNHKSVLANHPKSEEEKNNFKDSKVLRKLTFCAKNQEREHFFKSATI